MSKESREIEKLNPDEEVGKKRKIVFWSLLATGIGAIIIVVVLLLVFLLPKEEKFEIDLGSNVSVEDGTLTGEGSYKKGDSVTIVAEDIEGYRFTGWSYGGSIISTDKEFTFQINAENEGEYTANYAKIYSVSTFDNDNYGSFIVAPTEAIAGQTVTVRYEVNSENQDKYQLKRLYYVVAGDLQGTQTTIENNTFTMPEGNVTIYAEFNNLYNINLTTNIDEEVDLTGEGTYIENETVTITAPNVAGYRFRNWTYNGQAVTTQQEYTITNIDSTTSGTYIANYDRLYSITTNSTNGTVTIGESKTEAIENESVSFTVQPNADYRLIEVKINNETVVAQEGTYSFNMPAEDVTISVIYAIEYAITVDSNSSGYVQIEKQNAIAGESVEFTVLDRTDYRLIEVKVNNETVVAQEGTYSFNMPAGDVTITVTYAIEYAITVDSNSSGYVQIEKQNAIAGENVEFTVSEKVGYRVVEVKYNETILQSESNTYSFSMPAEDVTIAVTYSELFDIEVSSDHGKVTIAENKTEAIENESVSFTIQPSENYRIASVSINGGAVEYTTDESTYTFSMPAGDVTISVTYDREYAITVDSNSSEYVQIDKQNAIAGESVEFTVLDRTDYRLIEVKVNNETVVAQEGTYSFNMSAEDVTIAVTYSKLYDILVTSNYGTVTIAENKTEAIENESVSFTIQPSENYRIASVSINGGAVEYTTDESTYSFNMPAGIATISVTYDREYAVAIDSSASGKVTGVNVRTAINGEKIIVSANIQDSVEDNTVTLEGLYYIESGSEDRVPINQIDGQYSFTMPANNVTIYAESQTYRRLDDFTFSGNSITDYTGSDTELTLPAYYETISINSQNYTIEKNTGTQITEIREQAFYSCKNLTSITIPASVTIIGWQAFWECTNLQSVNFEANSKLQLIGPQAFYGCTSLLSIIIPASVLYIEDEAFRGCTKLLALGFETNPRLEVIGSAAFYGCFNPGLFVIIPPTVRVIGTSAFKGAQIRVLFNGSSIDITTDQYGSASDIGETIIVYQITLIDPNIIEIVDDGGRVHTVEVPMI